MTGRKRTYAYRPSQNKRRRKTYYRRRRRFGYGRKTSGLTSKNGTGGTFGFKSRRVSKRSWNSKLWNYTLQRQHVRSYFSTAEVQPVNASANLWNVHTRFVMPQFWTAGGGAQPWDTGVTLPTFASDLVVRGGMIGIKFVNNVADAVCLGVVCYLVKTGNNFDSTGIPLSVNHGWDPSLVPDFYSDVGKVILRREFLIENGNTAEMKYRLPVQKVDLNEFNEGKNHYVWIYMINGNEGGTSTMTVVRYHNMSFVGDAI